MSARHVVRRASAAQFLPPGDLAPDAEGLSRWRAVGYDDGASHTDFGVSRLAPRGTVPAHVHSFEESFHVTEGEVVLVTPEATVRLVAGDYGVIPIGTPHSWHAGDEPAVWADVLSPPPRPAHGSRSDATRGTDPRAHHSAQRSGCTFVSTTCRRSDP